MTEELRATPWLKRFLVRNIDRFDETMYTKEFLHTYDMTTEVVRGNDRVMSKYLVVRMLSLAVATRKRYSLGTKNMN